MKVNESLSWMDFFSYIRSVTALASFVAGSAGAAAAGAAGAGAGAAAAAGAALAAAALAASAAAAAAASGAWPVKININYTAPQKKEDKNSSHAKLPKVSTGFHIHFDFYDSKKMFQSQIIYYPLINAPTGVLFGYV